MMGGEKSIVASEATRRKGSPSAEKGKMFTFYANQLHRHHRSDLRAPTFQERKL